METCDSNSWFDQIKPHSHELLGTGILKDQEAAGRSFSAFSFQTGVETSWALICSLFFADLITQAGINDILSLEFHQPPFW